MNIENTEKNIPELSIRLLWTSDSNPSSFNSSFLFKQITDEKIDFICCARSNQSIKTAYFLRNKDEQLNCNVYILPFMTSGVDQFTTKLEDSTWVLRYINESHSNDSKGLFEDKCLSYIKNVALIKNNMCTNNVLFNLSPSLSPSFSPSFSPSLSPSRCNINVLMVTDSVFLKRYFSIESECEIETGQLYYFFYFYQNRYDEKPVKSESMKDFHKWYCSYRSFRSNSVNSHKLFLL